MKSKYEKIIDFGKKVSDGKSEGLAYFIKSLKPAEFYYEEKWRDLAVRVIWNLPENSGKKVLKELLKN